MTKKKPRKGLENCIKTNYPGCKTLHEALEVEKEKIRQKLALGIPIKGEK